MCFSPRARFACPLCSLFTYHFSACCTWTSATPGSRWISTVHQWAHSPNRVSEAITPSPCVVCASSCVRACMRARVCVCITYPGLHGDLQVHLSPVMRQKWLFFFPVVSSQQSEVCCISWRRRRRRRRSHNQHYISFKYFFRSIFNKVSVLLKFPKSPKVDKILPPIHVTSKLQRSEKMRRDLGTSPRAADEGKKPKGKASLLPAVTVT